MNDWKSLYQEEATTIKEERASYPVNSKKPNIGYKFFEYLSNLFLVCGFVALGLLFFTEITLVQATCLFVISYVIHPTDGDRYESQLKGIAEDLANIRINTTILGKYGKNRKT